jgi:hypothetical protein
MTCEASLGREPDFCSVSRVVESPAKEMLCPHESVTRGMAACAEGGGATCECPTGPVERANVPGHHT